MKEKFLELVEKVKETGIVEVMCVASTAEELKEVWRMFSEENEELFTEIEEWAEKFRKSEPGSIFEEREELKNPMEIAVVIFIINDAEKVTECEIFEDCDDLAKGIGDIENNFAKSVADFISGNVICTIKAEDIFCKEREAFLELVKEVKKTGIAEAVYNTASAKELKEVWRKFLNENSELIIKIREWTEKFKEAGCEAIFDREEELENPMEVAVVIFIINDEQRVSEAEIFEDYEDLTRAIGNIEDKVAERITEFIEYNFICRITAEDIFPEDDDSGEEDE